MASVEIIIREDAQGTAKRNKKAGQVVSRVKTSTGLKTGESRPTVINAASAAMVQALIEAGELV